jgi:hypothetical protein
VRKTGRPVRWLGLILSCLCGCQAPPSLKPPLHEEYVLPPQDDPRFSQPPTFPKETLDTGMMKKDSPKPGDPMRGATPPRFGTGAGPGMGGGY